MHRIGSHVFAPISTPCVALNFIKPHLVKLQPNFFHSSFDKLFELIRRALPDDANRETQRILEEINRYCHPCQRIQTGPRRLRVSFGTDEAVFN